jgi:ribosomal protein S18 acetylase RimI-like enzyme
MKVIELRNAHWKSGQKMIAMNYIWYSLKVSPLAFLHIGYRGSNVAWIEDIYIDKEHRSKGIASSSIHQAEEIIRANPQYTAVCLEVVPRNENALRLYHKLGYDSISIITV